MLATPMVTTRAKLEVERVEAGDALKSIGAAWDRLLDQNETRMAELTHSWQMTYWDHLAGDSQLFLLVVREADEIVAIAPLKLCKIRKLGIPIRYLEFIAADESNFQDFIIGRRREEVLVSILEFLVRHRSQWDVLYMRNLPERATTSRFFLDAPGRLDPSVESEVVGVRRCIYMEMEKTWKQYRENSAKMRNKIASKKRKLQKVGAITYFHCSNGQDFEKNLPRFFDLHRRRWNGTDTPSQFHDERHCRFYLEAGLRLLPKNQIDLFMFELDAKPIAGLLTLRYDRGCVQQITAYDPAHAHASPSLVMHEIFVEELFANGMQIFDFGNYYPYKETWANSFKNTLDIKVHLGGLIPRYDRLASTVLQELRGRIRKHDNLRKVAQFVRRRFRMLQAPGSHGTGV